MIELTPDQVNPALRALFPRSGHTWRRPFSVLDGSGGGLILTDDPVNPTWAATADVSDDGTVFMVGALNREIVAELFERRRKEAPVTICLAADNPLLSLLPPDPDYDGWDIDFEQRDHAVDLDQFITEPAGLCLAQIDAELLPRCQWGPWMVGSLATALEHGLGYCVLDGDQVISEAFAGPIVDNALEMAVITVDVHQRRGLATIVAARTIRECERRGHDTWWNTATTNLGSARLARKLGYRVERRYRVLSWSRNEG
ncbi:MAG TPA: GNAT family N-acetyltransferase [Thermomicrobiales bacterium]|nr:GNAT family N-acetyltransferase [Thermomicrobiales bacterium]